MSTTAIRINGRGDAWPVLLGQSHPMYSPNIAEDYANTSYSIVGYEGSKPLTENIQWEILIDAGHGIVPFLLKNNNRIPDACENHQDTRNLCYIFEAVSNPE